SGSGVSISVVLLDQRRLLREKPAIELCCVLKRRQPHATLDVPVFDVELAPSLQQVLAHTIDSVAQLADRDATEKTTGNSGFRAHDDVTVARNAARVGVLRPARTRYRLRQDNVVDYIQTDERVDERTRRSVHWTQSRKESK